jgi:hypothetical protein
LETQFEFGREFLQYETLEELCDMLSAVQKNQDTAQEIATSGHQRAMEQFSPGRLVATILSLWRVTTRDWRLQLSA